MFILRKIYGFLIDTVETLIIIGAILVVIYAFFFRPFQVNGQSMYPNFHNGEYVLTNLITLRFSEPDRGDVIVFQAPPDVEKDYIKRVIGLPEEHIIIKDNTIFINGKKLDETDYLSTSTRTYGGVFLHDNQEIAIPANNYFVMGDNREASSDSREWGFVSIDKIIGKSFIVYWPPQRFRVIQGASYK